MRPFLYQRASDLADAVGAASQNPSGVPPTSAPVQFLAGGTTILDLIKLDVMRPQVLVDISGAAPSSRRIGNVLQRTRCTYSRDPSWTSCNKREPGSGCAALDGVNRKHAVLGVRDRCIAAYPGDFAQALVALDGVAEIAGPDGGRLVPVEALHREPADTPHIETTLLPDEVIVGFRVPVATWIRHSLYLKMRDRESYEFALASAAIALDLADGKINQARIALGGVATRPWRSREAEAALNGHSLDESLANRAAEAAFATARPRRGSAYKVELGKRTLARALLQARQITT